MILCIVVHVIVAPASSNSIYCYAARGVYMILYAMDVRADSEVSQDEVSIPHFVSCLNIVIVLE
jgi:hypothetical protein